MEKNKVYSTKLEHILNTINNAKFLKKKGMKWHLNDYCREAGEEAEKLKNLELAIKMYAKGEAYYEAARCSEKNKDYGAAFRYYFKDGQYNVGLRSGLLLAKKVGDNSVILKFSKKLIKEWNRLKNELDGDEFDICYGPEDPVRAVQYYKEAGTAAAKLGQEKMAIDFYLKDLHFVASFWDGKYATYQFKKIFAEAKSQGLMKQLLESIKKGGRKDTAEHLLKIAKQMASKRKVKE